MSFPGSKTYQVMGSLGSRTYQVIGSPGSWTNQVMGSPGSWTYQVMGFWTYHFLGSLGSDYKVMGFSEFRPIRSWILQVPGFGYKY